MASLAVHVGSGFGDVSAGPLNRRAGVVERGRPTIRRREPVVDRNPHKARLGQRREPGPDIRPGAGLGPFALVAGRPASAMHEDDERTPGAKNTRKPEIKDASALPQHLGRKLRSLFSDVEAQPVPDRLRELMEALAAKEKKPE